MAVKGLIHYALEVPDPAKGEAFYRDFGLTTAEGGGNVVRYWHAPDRPMWRSVQEGFADIAASAAELGAPVLCVIFTQGNPPADPAGYPYGYLHAQVAEEARRHGLDVLDLLELYARMRAEGVRSQLPHLHPNVEGQRAAAAAIAERILAWPDAPHRR